MAKDDLSRILNSLGDEAVPPDARQMAEGLAGRFRQGLVQTKEPRHFMWREHIMRNRIVQLATAAAIIAAVSIGLYHLGVSPDGAGVVWGDVLAKVESVPAVTYKMRMTVTYPQGQVLIDESDIYMAGDRGTRIDSYKDGERYMVKYLVPERKLCYIVHPQLKRYMERTVSDEQIHQQDPRQWLKWILSWDHVELGRNEIDGIEVEGIEATRDDQETLRLWVDVQTHWPVRIESEGQMKEAGRYLPTHIIMDQFQWDSETDPALFEPNIPEDYTLSPPR